jgi:hypothetical protein
MSTEIKARQSTTLWSWDTSVSDIKVSIKNGHIELSIADITVVISAVKGQEVFDLIRKFGEVEVVNTTTQQVRV